MIASATDDPTAPDAGRMSLDEHAGNCFILAISNRNTCSLFDLHPDKLDEPHAQAAPEMRSDIAQLAVVSHVQFSSYLSDAAHRLEIANSRDGLRPAVRRVPDHLLSTLRNYRWFLASGKHINLTCTKDLRIRPPKSLAPDDSTLSFAMTAHSRTPDTTDIPPTRVRHEPRPFALAEPEFAKLVVTRRFPATFDFEMLTVAPALVS